MSNILHYQISLQIWQIYIVMWMMWGFTEFLLFIKHKFESPLEKQAREEGRQMRGEFIDLIGELIVIAARAPLYIFVIWLYKVLYFS